MAVMERANKFKRLPPQPTLKAMLLEHQVLQVKLSKVEVVANHGDGLVKAHATCDGKLKRIEFSGRCKYMTMDALSEVATAAANDAIEKARLRQRKADEVLMDKQVPELIDMVKTLFMQDPELRKDEMKMENMEDMDQVEREMEILRQKKRERDEARGGGGSKGVSEADAEGASEDGGPDYDEEGRR